MGLEEKNIENHTDYFKKCGSIKKEIDGIGGCFFFLFKERLEYAHPKGK